MASPNYRSPVFDQPRFVSAPEARFEPCPADGVLPEGFFSTSNLPTYVKVGGRWLLHQGPARRSKDRHEAYIRLRPAHGIPRDPNAVGSA